MCILSYIYDSHYLELGEDIELFYVVQDFCLVTVASSGLAQGGPGAKESALAPGLGRGRAEPGRGITISTSHLIHFPSVCLSFFCKQKMT